MEMPSFSAISVRRTQNGSSSKIMTRHKLPVGLEEKVSSGELVLSPPLSALQSAQFASSSPVLDKLDSVILYYWMRTYFSNVYLFPLNKLSFYLNYTLMWISVTFFKSLLLLVSKVVS